MDDQRIKTHEKYAYGIVLANGHDLLGQRVPIERHDRHFIPLSQVTRLTMS
jgi:hypothetical protein